MRFSQYICDILHQKKLFTAGVQVHIRTASLVTKEFSETFKTPTNSSLIFAKRGFELFLKNYSFGEPLRSIGLRAINLKNDKNAFQIDIFGDSEIFDFEEKIEDSIYNLKQKFGEESIKRATTIKKPKF